jgi:hypothetical protein
METLREAIERLERAGFRQSFRARPDGFLELGTNRIHAPERLVVEEIVRFEGESDPEDEAVLFALSSREGARATFVASYGSYADPDSAALMHRLEPAHGHRDLRFEATRLTPIGCSAASVSSR